MTGLALFDFIISLIELFICGIIIFAGFDFIDTDERFKKIAKLALGGVIVIAFLFAIRGFFWGGAGAFAITPLSILFFAIGIIFLLVGWYLVLMALDAMVVFFPPLAGFKEALKFVLSAVVLVLMLLLAADLLFGAGIMIHNTGGRLQLNSPGPSR
jgi:hypothetical protein